jgi:hypothetical protein
MQHALNRDVINPHEGHILCVPYPAIRGFKWRILWSSRRVSRARSRPTTMLVAFIKETLLHEFRIVCRNVTLPALVLLAQVASRGMCRPSLAEKPKVGGLQMDWLRSEDLKEVKVITAPTVSITLKCCANASAIRETMCVGIRIRGKLERFFTITGISKILELHRFL